jgi:hypothetical protein
MPTAQVIEVIDEVFNPTGASYQDEHQAHVDKAMNTPEARHSKIAQGVDGAVAAHAHSDQGSTRLKRHLLLRRFWRSATGYWRSGGDRLSWIRAALWAVAGVGLTNIGMHGQRKACAFCSI